MRRRRPGYPARRTGPLAAPVTAAALAAIDTACAEFDAPLLALHLPSLRANLKDLRGRAAGTPIRLATKSIRCRSVLAEALGPDLGGDESVRGVMAYSLREALWLVESGFPDVLLGYPSVDRVALSELGRSPVALDAVTLMVDDCQQLEVAAAAGLTGARICIDMDASLRIGPVHLGVRRSPLRTPEDAARIASEAAGRGFRVVGVMFYEAQVAGMRDGGRAIDLVKSASMRRLLGYRSTVARAIAAVAGEQLEIVNSGGTGCLEDSAADPAVTEVTAGSGLYMPALFDHYRAFTPRPALFFALPAVRHPAPGITTFHCGGYPASGVPGRDRLPNPERPSRMAYLKMEGAGEVQTPMRGSVPIGGRAWWRPAKAGEVCERFAVMHVVDDIDGQPVLTATVPTYRGEGKCFG